jgi:hypothetical protein
LNSNPLSTTVTSIPTYDSTHVTTITKMKQ